MIFSDPKFWPARRSRPASAYLSPMKHVSRALFAFLFVCAALFLPAGAALAITIFNESPAVNYRFSSGFRTGDPVQNTNPSFLAAGYDLSSIGWWNRPGDNSRVKHTTLVAPLFSVNAVHYPFQAGDVVEFLSADGNLKTNTVAFRDTARGDLSVTRYESAFTESDQVSVIRILDISTLNYTGQPALIVGSTPNPSIGTEFATARVLAANVASGGVSFQGYNQDNSLSFLQLQSGDSGSPTLIPYKGEITLIGTVTSASAGGTVYSPTETNSLLSAYGYALKFTIYDVPSDTANTANVWTGGSGSGDFFTGGNWSRGSAPGDQPVIFDVGAGGGQSAITLNAGQSLRGLLFRANAGTTGFTFNGSGTLTTGWTGIRNEDAKTQTFNVAMKLAASQNWEAAEGNLEFNGNIDNAGYLVVVGGAKDTAISGVLSGEGGLAKDDAGTLTLNAVNTYTGTTFIHNGTVRLGAGGNLGTGAVTFSAGNEALLDLNGRNQTLASLSSGHGGTGRVVLGGATLSVNAASGTTSYLGSIEGNGTLIKSGAGVWALGGENTHGGPTRLTGGVLRLASEGALSAASNLVINGGVLELGAGDLTRSLGTGAGEIQFLGTGGFSAHGGTRIVNLGGTGATLTWGSGGFVTSGSVLQLSSMASDSIVVLSNGINLAGGARTIFVDNGLAAIDARIEGELSNGALIKTGNGNLELTGHNTYAGQTQVNGGALQVSSSGALGAGNLSLNGGVLILASGDFSRTLGTGTGQVQFAGSGGFAASGGTRIVDLGGNGATLIWGSGGFVGEARTLLLSTAASDSTVILNNGIDLNGTARTIQANDGSAAVDARIAGVLSNGSLIKTGAGTLELAAANTYSGQTQINGGGLLVSHASALGAGNLSLNSGGVLVLGTGDFTRTPGTGAGQVQFAGSGGFAARGAERSVNLGGAGAALTWGTGGFTPSGNALYLSATSADATVNFVNPIDLAAAARTFWVADGSATVDARLLGALSNGGLTKGGAGLLELTVANSYSGVTRVDGGVLRLSHPGALPSVSNLLFSGGGVLELATGDFSRSLGTGAGQVQFAGNGGFSAYGADRSVNLGGAGATVTWNSTNGLPTQLVLASATSDATLNWQNPIVLGSATSLLVSRTITVHDGSASIDAKMNGAISGIGWGLEKNGDGVLELTDTNTHSGRTVVSAGTLVVSGQLTATSAVTVREGAGFVYRGASSLNRRVEVAGGTFLYDSASAFTGALDFSSGLIGGSGNLSSIAISVGENRTISPGNSAGALTTGTLNWQSGGTYLWEISSLSGGAGTGWDLLSIQGNLNILSSPEGFTLRLDSLGGLAGWDATLSQTWTIATATGGINGFASGLFTIDSSGFAAENLLEGGSFSLLQSGTALNLVFTAVPEPSAAMLIGFSFLLLGRVRKAFHSGNDFFLSK